MLRIQHLEMYQCVTCLCSEEASDSEDASDEDGAARQHYAVSARKPEDKDREIAAKVTQACCSGVPHSCIHLPTGVANWGSACQVIGYVETSLLPKGRVRETRCQS